jgi:hypothetical protein
MVNMSAKELKDWLSQEESAESGWSKDDGSETVGHEREAYQERALDLLLIPVQRPQDYRHSREESEEGSAEVRPENPMSLSVACANLLQI